MSSPLASRVARFAARLIDSVLLGALVVPFSLPNLRAISETIASALLLGLIVAQAIVYAMRGQTIGKLLLRIRIVEAASEAKPPVWRLYLVRTLLNLFLCTLPVYVFVDAGFIFRKDRRCLHDLLARTRVVRA